MRRSIPWLTGLLWMLVPTLLGAAEPEITLHRVNYDQLTRLVQTQRGKVVVVDFWASYCQPCRKAFPHLIQMHQKYAAQGCTIITVSMDDPSDEDAAKAALAFLRQTRAPFTNVLLDEKPESWKKKLPLVSLPTVYLFNAQGQIEQRYLDAPDYAALDRLVAQLLKRK